MLELPLGGQIPSGTRPQVETAEDGTTTVRYDGGNGVEITETFRVAAGGPDAGSLERTTSKTVKVDQRIEDLDVARSGAGHLAVSGEESPQADDASTRFAEYSKRKKPLLDDLDVPDDEKLARDRTDVTCEETVRIDPATGKERLVSESTMFRQRMAWNDKLEPKARTHDAVDVVKEVDQEASGLTLWCSKNTLYDENGKATTSIVESADRVKTGYAEAETVEVDGRKIEIPRRKVTVTDSIESMIGEDGKPDQTVRVQEQRGEPGQCGAIPTDRAGKWSNVNLKKDFHERLGDEYRKKNGVPDNGGCVNMRLIEVKEKGDTVSRCYDYGDYDKPDQPGTSIRFYERGKQKEWSVRLAQEVTGKDWTAPDAPFETEKPGRPASDTEKGLRIREQTTAERTQWKQVEETWRWENGSSDRVLRTHDGDDNQTWMMSTRRPTTQADVLAREDARGESLRSDPLACAFLRKNQGGPLFEDRVVFKDFRERDKILEDVPEEEKRAQFSERRSVTAAATGDRLSRLCDERLEPGREGAEWRQETLLETGEKAALRMREGDGPYVGETWDPRTVEAGSEASPVATGESPDPSSGLANDLRKEVGAAKAGTRLAQGSLHLGYLATEGIKPPPEVVAARAVPKPGKLCASTIGSLGLVLGPLGIAMSNSTSGRLLGASGVADGIGHSLNLANSVKSTASVVQGGTLASQVAEVANAGSLAGEAASTGSASAAGTAATVGKTAGIGLLKGASMGMLAAGAVLGAVSGAFAFKEGNVAAGTLNTISAGATAASVAVSAATSAGLLTASAATAAIPVVGGIVAAATGLAALFVGLFGGDKRKTARLEF